MGFWNKLGKIALTAAPYVAAPFTGGASLMATGLANKAVQKWSESDAKKAMGKGLAPSKFDSVLGKVGGISSLASSFIPTNALGAVGMLGSAGKAGSVASQVGKTASAVNAAQKGGGFASTLGKIAQGATGAGKGWQGALGGVLANAATSRIGAEPGGTNDPNRFRTPDFNPSAGGAVSRPTPGMGGGAMPRGGFRYSENPLNQYDQSSPNLALALHQGRQEAIKNQPFRRGYEVNTLLDRDDEGNPITSTVQMPRITSGRPDKRRRAY